MVAKHLTVANRILPIVTSIISNKAEYSILVRNARHNAHYMSQSLLTNIITSWDIQRVYVVVKVERVFENQCDNGRLEGANS